MGSKYAGADLSVFPLLRDIRTMLPISLKTPATTTPQTSKAGYITAGQRIVDNLRLDESFSLFSGIMIGALLNIQVTDNTNDTLFICKPLRDRSQLSVDFSVAGQITVAALVDGVIKESFNVLPNHHAWNNLCNCPARARVYAAWQAWEKEPKFPDEERSKAFKLVKDSFYGITVTFLDLKGLNLRSLPAQLPPQVTYLSVNQNRLTSLPHFSEGLVTLMASENELTELPKLPLSLRTLDASKNKIAIFPFLPANLRVLDLSHNKLTTTLDLPKRLTHIFLSNNLLKVYPDFPPDIEEVDISFNEISSLPEITSATSDCEKADPDIADFIDSASTDV